MKTNPDNAPGKIMKHKASIIDSVMQFLKLLFFSLH